MAVGTLGGAIYAIGGQFLIIYFLNVITIFSGLDDQNCYKTVERYDIELNRWTTVSDMNVPRGGVAVTTYGIKIQENNFSIYCSENHLYAVGGNSGTSSLNSCERYDPICQYQVLTIGYHILM